MPTAAQTLSLLATRLNPDFLREALDEAEFTTPGLASFPIHSVCLADQPPVGKLSDWALVLPRSDDYVSDPCQIIGAMVRVPRGRTSPIASIDPATRRVRTHSGTIYQLGVPHQSLFEQPAVLQALGF